MYSQFIDLFYYYPDMVVVDLCLLFSPKAAVQDMLKFRMIAKVWKLFCILELQIRTYKHNIETRFAFYIISAV